MDYHISTITLNTFINQDINLLDLSTYLKVDDDILGYKYKWDNQVIIKGIFKKNNRISFFNNQMTLKLQHPIINRIINVKIFSNGSFHFTGCTNTNDGELLTKLLIHKFNNIQCNDSIKVTRDTNGILFNKETNVIYNDSLEAFGQRKDDNNYTINNIFYQFIKTKNVFTSKKFTNKSKEVRDSNGMVIGNCEIRMLRGTKFYINNNIIIDMERESILLNEQLIGNIVYNTKPIINSPVRDINTINYEIKKIQNCIIHTKINCINICFKTSFTINRLQLLESLKKLNYIITYNPEIYSGVKLAYKQNDQSKGICECTDKCQCNTVTFLIFESGSIIATNFKDINCIDNVLKSFMTLIK